MVRAFVVPLVPRTIIGFIDLDDDGGDKRRTVWTDLDVLIRDAEDTRGLHPRCTAGGKQCTDKDYALDLDALDLDAIACETQTFHDGYTLLVDVADTELDDGQGGENGKGDQTPAAPQGDDNSHGEGGKYDHGDQDDASGKDDQTLAAPQGDDNSHDDEGASDDGNDRADDDINEFSSTGDDVAPTVVDPDSDGRSSEEWSPQRLVIVREWCRPSAAGGVRAMGPPCCAVSREVIVS